MFRQGTAWDGLPGPAMAARLASLTTLPADVDEPACGVHPADGGPALVNSRGDRRDLADLPDADLIEVLAASEALAGWAAAQQLLVLAEFDRRQPAVEAEFSADQIAPAVTWTRLTAQARLNLATMACGQYPELLDGMLEGTISLAKAQIICDQTSCLRDAVIDDVITTVLPHVPGWTTGQLRHHLARIIVAADPDGARLRAERAKKDRDVFLRQGEHGNATFQALLDAYDAAAAFEIIDRAAHTTATPGDTRNLGQRRSDVLLDLILGRTTPGPASTISTAPAGTPGPADDDSPADASPADTDNPASPASGTRPSDPASEDSGSTGSSPAASDSPATPAGPASGNGPADPNAPAASASQPPPEPAAPPAPPAQAATSPAPAPSPAAPADSGPAAPAQPAGQPPADEPPAGQSPAGLAGWSPAGQSSGAQERGASVGSIINVVIPFPHRAPARLPATGHRDHRISVDSTI